MPVVGIGCEGLDPQRFLDLIAESGIDFIADVRLTPLSRKPGFSKRRLAALLEQSGIEYGHFPALGNPKWNRAAFGGCDEDRKAAKELYSNEIADPAAVSALEEIASLSEVRVVGLLCFEKDDDKCHRSVVSMAVAGRAAG